MQHLISRDLSSGLPSEQTETATFAMGCFWSPDALFGSKEGVTRTRVGYAGGSTLNPTYWKLADHIETVQLDFVPTKIAYSELLQLFFSSHKVTRAPWKRQYMSALFCHTPVQEQQAWQAKAQLEKTSGSKVYTQIYPYNAFYLAEDRHQKYKLQRHPALMEELLRLYPTRSALIHSTAAARVNGFLYGYGNIQELRVVIHELGLSPAAQEILLRK